MREFAPSPYLRKMDDPTREEIERERARLRQVGIEHEIRLSAGRSVGSKKSAQSKKSVKRKKSKRSGLSLV